MPAWSKKRAEQWMREFINQHQIVPVASLRRTYKGPPDTELIRHWGSVRRALCDWKEFHGTAADALEAQTKHLKSHGVTRARKR